VWSDYSTRQAAELVGLPESAVRGLVRDRFVGTAGDLHVKLSFRDLAVLKMIKALVGGGVPLPRVRKELGALKARLPSGATLAELSLVARDGHVAVRGAAGTARADSGQLVIDFAADAAATAPPLADVSALPVRREAPAPEPEAPLTGDEWFDRALALEESDTAGAIEAYRRALRLRPDSSETWVNLGRLYAENNDAAQATTCFREALRIDPGDATAIYNLGVVAQDGGRDEEAVGLYSHALELDPQLAEAHYNLATLLDRAGDARAAIRHINEYRKLTRGS
jgi:tetratricopeptide (TPR) repeat protein